MSTLHSSEEVRQQFLSFFEAKTHEIVPSAPIVPQNDPSLLFTNAGMNQFKDVFLGTGSRAYVRAADTQKCLRVSGKHNDLEEVGHDTYHHTFFEMLGNWSFGDYFKEEAIAWAWELLTEVWGMEPERLYATVHEGDEQRGLEPDTEAARFWEEVTGIDPDHILFCSSDDNFWMMGETGPCGPCSEIHIDLRSDEERERVPGHELVNADHPHVMEIWNLVFIQYNAQADGSLEPLDAQHVDTGMGFERLCAVLQGKDSTYDTDLFEPLLQKIADRSPRAEVKGYDEIDLEGANEVEKVRVAMRVIADHIRAISFAIADGVTPGNVGRGYVIRRILRRAVRYGYQTLELKSPFLHELVGPLTDKMGSAFSELERARDYIERVIRSEEESFLQTLGTGLDFFHAVLPHLESIAASEETGEEAPAIEALRSDSKAMDLLEKAFVDADAEEERVQLFVQSAARRQLAGEIAFLFHDTYGFPIDLTRLMAREEGLAVDQDGYERMMERQRTRAREAQQFSDASAEDAGWTVLIEDAPTEFVGYDAVELEGARIAAYREREMDEETRYELVLDRTPFYAESGGQIGDTGVLEIDGEQLIVTDTQKQQGRYIHVVDQLPQTLDAPVTARVDAERRAQTQLHHTATHLLHAALRDVLGPHVQQKGSLVAPDRLRFDFSHFDRVSDEELRVIERQVNRAIQRNIEQQEERAVPIDDALERGAMALFGEKYGEHVRVITFDPDYSVELCGGTHAPATGDIGLFRIVSEGSVAAGVRRIEAVAGEAAIEAMEEERETLRRVRSSFRSLQRPIEEEVADLLEENKRLQKELDRLEQQQLAGHLDAFIENARELGPVRLVTGRMDQLDMDALQELAQTLRDRTGKGTVSILGATGPDGEKVYLVATVSDDLIEEQGLKAGALVGPLAKKLGGGGGGRPQLASAGGRRPEALDEVLQEAADLIERHLAKA